MKIKRIITLVAFILLASVFSGSNVFAECIPNYRSCDQNNPCCDFPQFLCSDGYCVPKNITCGNNYEPCCNLPNPSCSLGLVCSGGYCVNPVTPTPIPSCGTYGQQCCSSGTSCYSGLSCIGGFCYPETTSCGNLGQECCSSGTPCRTENTECRGGLCQTIPMPTPTTSLPGGSTAEDDEEDNSAASGEPQGNSYIEGNLCDDGNGLNTALGCIPFSVDDLVGFFLKNLMGLVGSVALIMIVYGSFLVMTSSGSPDKVAQGKEIITAAISGLLFAILSIFILRLIGVTWLQLPGLS